MTSARSTSALSKPAYTTAIAAARVSRGKISLTVR